MPRGRSIGIEWDTSEFEGSLQQATAELAKDGQAAILSLADDAASGMRSRASDDRALAGSIKVQKRPGYVEVGTNHPHAKWREYGTGVFGPGHRPIVPSRKKALAGKLAHPVEQVAGARPRPFFRPSINLAIRHFKGWLR